MRGINKQKFLTELGRLLTFMYEEDRERALALYSSLFDETDDETGLLQLMVSPTRQAVNLARAYDARERKLQTMAQGEDEDDPGFVRVIEQLREQAASLGAPAGRVLADQMSLFESAAAETKLFDELETPAEPPAQESAPVEAAPAPAEELSAPAEEPEAAPATPAEAEPAPEQPLDPVDSFLADFRFSDETDAAAEAESADPVLHDENDAPDGQPSPDGGSEQPELPDLPAAPAAPAVFEDLPAAEAVQPKSEFRPSSIRAGTAPVFTQSKPRVGLLLLFLLLAVPVTLGCIALLLIPAGLSLGVGLFAGTLGFTGLTAAFGGFTVFADILLVFGCTLAALALALLFLWIFIWLIGGAIPGLIRGVCALARKWCYKEVPVK